jgi:hypothetical protein
MLKGVAASTIRPDRLEKVRLSRPELDASELEPTQTNVTDQHG